MSKKRYPTPRAKPGELRAAYGRLDGELQIVYAWGGGGSSKPDCRVLMAALEEAEVHGRRSLAKELEARGYDLSTLKFSIQQAKGPQP